jgi:hypothetical protein
MQVFGLKGIEHFQDIRGAKVGVSSMKEPTTSGGYAADIAALVWNGSHAYVFHRNTAGSMSAPDRYSVLGQELSLHAPILAASNYMLVDFAILLHGDTVLCDRAGHVSVRRPDGHVVQLERGAYFHQLDYYMMGKVFTIIHQRWLVYIDRTDRSHIVVVDTASKIYESEIIKVPMSNIFQVVNLNSESDMLGILSDESPNMLIYHLLLKQPYHSITLDAKFSYRTIAGHYSGYFAVAGVQKQGHKTQNRLYLFDKHYTLLSHADIQVEGSHLGRYFHKLVIFLPPKSKVPIVLAVMHHYEATGLYAFGMSTSSKQLKVLKQKEPIATSWVWDIIEHKGDLYIATSSDSILKIPVAL